MYHGILEGLDVCESAVNNKHILLLVSIANPSKTEIRNIQYMYSIKITFQNKAGCLHYMVKSTSVSFTAFQKLSLLSF